MRPRIAILSFSNIASDGRVLRQIAVASSAYEVDVYGHGQWQPPSGVRFFSIPRLSALKEPWYARWLRLLQYFSMRFSPAAAESVYWSRQSHREALNLLQGNNYQLIHANDWEALPVAALAARRSGARLIFDAHEYTPDQDTGHFVSVLLWREYRVSLLKLYAGEVNAFITVSDGLSGLYRERFGWDCMVIKNAPFYQEVSSHAASGERVQLVYHGAPAPNRRLEELIYLLKMLEDRFTLSLVLLPSNPPYVQKLKSLAGHLTPGRVTFHLPWAVDEIVGQLSAFDLGLAVFPPNRSNHIYALPNKFLSIVWRGLPLLRFPARWIWRKLPGSTALVLPVTILRNWLNSSINLLPSRLMLIRKMRWHMPDR